MINKLFFERFTTEELKRLEDYIESIVTKRDKRFPDLIRDSDVSIRCKKLLQGMSVERWDELADYSEDQINKIKHLGTKTLKEIFYELEKRGLR